MSDNNRNLRVRVNINGNENNVSLKLDQDIDNIDILSLSISTGNFYKYHTSDYGCLVGRVIANGGIGVPNARISLFVQADNNWLDENILSDLYPYTSVVTKNSDGIRYNVLPEEVVSKCHTPVGTMPSKRMLLDDSNILEIYENFYKFTTVTNNAGDYMLFGIPTGDQIIHMDLDLSDCGYLSQRPRDMMYKGYNIDMFENANKFKKSDNIDGLPQIISQNNSIYIYPFWCNDGESEAKITRNDISVNYQFIPTCVFIGSIVSDEPSNSISTKCIAAERMGQMNRLTTGSGRIEMIRKNANGAVEEFQVQGTELIDGNGTWCYQIPMNLDYVKTDEYGNLVPSEDPNIGIATRTRVRFRVSLNDYESDYTANHLAKVLIPNNPKTFDDLDYHFGSATNDNDEATKSFRDLFWNNVYTVKSYVPRIQKGNTDRNRKFTGFKMVNVAEGKNQIPYNNIRVRLTFMFVLQCAVMKALIWIMGAFNKRILVAIYRFVKIFRPKKAREMKCVMVGDGICPDLDGWYFAPKCEHGGLFDQTFGYLREDLIADPYSIDEKNKDNDEAFCLTNQVDYLIQCIEINLAQEYEVIKFDFYNDWINGLIYIPRWEAKYKKKRTLFFGLIKRKAKTLGCFDYSSETPFKTWRRQTQQCALTYQSKDKDGYYTDVTTTIGCHKKRQKCHKTSGRKFVRIFSGNIKGGGGLCHIEETIKGDKVYYFKPCEFHKSYDRTYENRINMFATDIVLLGSLNECDENGLPMAFKELTSTTYIMPGNLAGTNMDNEGYMYTYGQTKEAKCLNKHIQEPIYGLSGDSQTFSNYIIWSRPKEYYEKEPNDITEYAITESAGIDWGWTGPNQGTPDENVAYNPGGHFLGISCVNSQTNIKSCVNLSRICEVGSYMSSRNHILLKNKSGNDVEFAYLQPTGFISKDELSDSQFRTMFATLNLNGLKTVVDEKTNYRKYEFISNTPTNFLGEFEKYTNNTSYNKQTSRSDKGKDNATTDAYLFTRTFEYRSNDYYKFRFGLLGEPDRNEMKKHYGLYVGNTVSIPMYENSFYFYFGLVDGNTSLDRFFRDYFSNCEKYDEDASFFMFKTFDAEQCVRSNGGLNVKFNNVESPYGVAIYGSDGATLYFYEDNGEVRVSNEKYYYHILPGGVEIYTKNESESDAQYSVESTNYSTNSRDITINGLSGTTDGKAYSVLLSSADGQSKFFDINIGLSLPDDIKNIQCDGNDFTEEYMMPKSRLWYEIQHPNTGNTVNVENCGNIIINTESNSFSSNVIGFVVSTDSTFTCIGPNEETIELVKDKYNAETENHLLYNKYERDEGDYRFGSGNKMRVYVWDDIDNYFVYAAYYCGNNEVFFLNVGNVSLNLEKSLDIYIYDLDLLYNETIKPLIDAGLCTRVNWWGYMLTKFSGITETVRVKKDGEIYEGDDEDDIKDVITEITPKQLWNIRKAFYYNHSLYESLTSSQDGIVVGPTGGKPPYKEILFGAEERAYTDETVIEDEEDAGKPSDFIQLTPPNKAFITDQEIVTQLNNDNGRTCAYISDSSKLSLNNIVFPTIGIDFSIGSPNNVTYYGYSKNEMVSEDMGVAISFGISDANRYDNNNLSLYGSNCFYSRQLCINYGGPDDSSHKWVEYSSNSRNLPISTTKIGQKMMVSKFTYYKIPRLWMNYTDVYCGPKWGPKIHYGIRFEDTTNTTIKYTGDTDTDGTLIVNKGEVPVKNGNKWASDVAGNGFIGGTYWDAYGDRYYSNGLKRTPYQTWHHPDERYFLTLPSIYAPFFFNVVFIIEGGLGTDYSGTTEPSIKCVFRINNGITYPRGTVYENNKTRTKFKFDSIVAKITGSNGTINIIKDDKSDESSDDFYRTTGDFPNKRSTVLNDTFNGHIENVPAYSETADYSYKKIICDFRGNITGVRKIDDQGKYDMDIVNTLPFDLCDCMYDAMPMVGWGWCSGNTHMGGGFGPFDSFNNSFTSGKSETFTYRDGGRNLQLESLVNGDDITLSFEVTEGSPDNSDNDISPMEISATATVKFLNAGDYGDSGNIRYFYLSKERLDGGTPFYENIGRSFTFYGHMHTNFIRNDSLAYNENERFGVHCFYQDPEHDFKYDRPYSDPRAVGDGPFNIGCRPLFSGVYSSTFLLDDTDYTDWQFTNLHIYRGRPLSQVDAAVEELRKKQETDTSVTIDITTVMKLIYNKYDSGITDGYVIGISDQFLTASGSYKVSPFVKHTIWDAIPKDTNLISVVRKYELNDFKELLSNRYNLD